MEKFHLLLRIFFFSGDRNYYTLKTEDVIMVREEWRKLEKESYLKIVNNSGKASHGSSSSNKKAVTIKPSDNIKKRPEGEESSADEESSEPDKETAENGGQASSKVVSSSATASKSASSKTSVPASTLSKKKKLRRSRKNSDRSNVTTSLLDLKPGDKVIFWKRLSKTTVMNDLKSPHLYLLLVVIYLIE